MMITIMTIMRMIEVIGMIRIIRMIKMIGMIEIIGMIKVIKRAMMIITNTTMAMYIVTLLIKMYYIRLIRVCSNKLIKLTRVCFSFCVVMMDLLINLLMMVQISSSAYLPVIG